MKKIDCIYAKKCNCNCLICDIYKSNKPKNRDRLIMKFVSDYLGTENNIKRNIIVQKANKELTNKEIIVFNFEISNRGI
jgi:hypothetical protein